MQETSQNSTTPILLNTVLADAVFRPMLFSTTMVKALLDGSKTQTRRIVNPYPVIDKDSGYVYDGKLRSSYDIHNWKERFINDHSKCQVGDVIWVRETFGEIDHPELKFRYKSDHLNPKSVQWKPSLFMSKEACRLFLKVIDVRIERLQDISEDDAISEGILRNHGGFEMYYNFEKIPNYCLSAVESYKSLWRKINGKDSWLQNPLVLVYSFERVECPHGFR